MDGSIPVLAAMASAGIGRENGQREIFLTPIKLKLINFRLQGGIGTLGTV